MGAGVTNFSVTGVVTRVTSEGPFCGAIFRIRSKSSPEGVRVCASYRVMRDAPWRGEILEVRGTYSESTFGRQLEACVVLRKLPEREQIVSFIEHHPYFLGVGERAISSLWRKQGQRLYELLNNHDVGGLVGQGVTVRQAGVLARGWKQYCTEVEVQRYAVDHELQPSTVKKANEMWGPDAFSKIANDPYCLLLFDRWETIDYAARTVFKIELTSVLRRRGACLKVLNDAAASGRLSLRESEARQRIARYLQNDGLAEKAIKECLKCSDIKKRGRGATSYLQSRGASILELSLSRVIARRNLALTLRDGEAHRLLETVILDETQRVWNQDAWTAGRPVMHVLISNSVSSGLRARAANESVVSAQELLAGGLDTPHSVDVAFVHDATSLNFFAMHALLRRLDRAIRIVLVCYTPCRPEPYFRQNLFNELSSARNQVDVASEETVCASWSETTHEASSPEALERSMTGGSQYARLTIRAKDLREGYDVACGQFRMCSSVGSSILLTMTRITANLMNRQFHVENLDARKYQSLPCPVVALARQRYATVGDQVICDGSNFARRLLRGARGEIRQVWKRGFVEVDEKGVHELAMTVCFDGVGDVNIRRAETSQFRLGYATSFLDPVLSRVEFAVVLLARSHFPASDAIALATSRSASATVVIGTTKDLLEAGIAACEDRGKERTSEAAK